MRTSLTLCVGAVLAVVSPSDPVRAQDLETAKASVVRITSKLGDQQRTGTGFVVRVEPDLAYIVTSSHVVAGDSGPQVEFLTRRNRPVTAGIRHIEGENPDGLALLTVRGANNIPAGLKPLPFGSSASVQAGHEVSVIGFGQGAGDWAVIVARVASRKGRDLRLDGRFGAGNSGGPVLRDGRVVALVTSVEQGFGVSLPSLFVETILEGWGNKLAPDLRVRSPATEPGGSPTPPPGTTGTTDITLQFVADTLSTQYGCALQIGVNIGGTSANPNSNPYTIRNVPLGRQNYQLKGQVGCSLIPNPPHCVAEGRGTITVETGGTYGLQLGPFDPFDPGKTCQVMLVKR